MNSDLKHQLISHLKLFACGRVRAIQAKHLAAEFDADIREVNEAIRQLRKEGVLIGSAKEKPYGYYIPVTEVEIREYLGAFRNELFDMLKTFNVQKRAAKSYRDNLHTKDLFQANTSGQMVFA